MVADPDNIVKINMRKKEAFCLGREASFFAHNTRLRKVIDKNRADSLTTNRRNVTLDIPHRGI